MAVCDNITVSARSAPRFSTFYSISSWFPCFLVEDLVQLVDFSLLLHLLRRNRRKGFFSLFLGQVYILSSALWLLPGCFPVPYLMLQTKPSVVDECSFLSNSARKMWGKVCISLCIQVKPIVCFCGPGRHN